MSELQTTNLRDGWRVARVGEILKVRNGYAFKSTDYRDEGVPLIRQSNLGDDLVDVSDAKRVDPQFLKELPGFIVENDDLLIGMSGSLGKIARYQNSEPALQNQRTGLLMVKPDNDRKFAKLVLKYVEPQIIAEGKGIAVQNVSAKEIEDCVFPLPPPDDQRRIVAEIEKQFTRLEAGVAALRRVQANLKRYRASVLKAACEGRLVPTHAEWKQTTLGEVLIGIEAGRSFRCEERPPKSDEIGVVKVSAVTWGTYDETESKTCRDVTRMEERFLVRPNDFLFSRANTIELIGACVIAHKITLRVMLSDKILRFQFSAEANPSWILYWLRSGFGRSEIERLATGNQNSMRNIGQERIRQINIKLPPLAEQTRIVAEVERRLSVVEELEAVVTTNLQRATRLRQSILHRAFEGKL